MHNMICGLFLVLSMTLVTSLAKCLYSSKVEYNMKNKEVQRICFLADSVFKGGIVAIGFYLFYTGVIVISILLTKYSIMHTMCLVIWY